MKIRSKIPLCRKCSKKISTLGYPCNSLMELILELYMQKIPFTFHDGNKNDRIFKTPLQFLEKKGYIISTEIAEKWVQVIPNLSKCKKGFCWC